jgi:hypothetical protein
MMAAQIRYACIAGMAELTARSLCRAEAAGARNVPGRVRRRHDTPRSAWHRICSRIPPPLFGTLGVVPGHRRSLWSFRSAAEISSCQNRFIAM